jgi:hypothetical protein
MWRVPSPFRRGMSEGQGEIPRADDDCVAVVVICHHE